MITVQNGSSRSETLQNATFGGVMVVVKVTGVANTGLTESCVDMTQINVQATLTRKTDKEVLQHRIVGDFARQLGLASGYGSAYQDYVRLGNTNDGGYDVVLAQAVGIAPVGYKFIYIPFGGPVCCVGSDQIELKVTNATSTFSATLTTQASCEVNAMLVPTEGIEKYLPQVNVDTIPNGESSVTYAFPALLKKAIFVNLDKASILEADSVIQNVQITSDTYNNNLLYPQLLNKRSEAFSTKADANELCQTFELVPFNKDKFYNNAQAQLLLNKANVNQGVNFMVSWSAVPSQSSEVRSTMQIQQLVGSVKTIQTNYGITPATVNLNTNN